MTHNQILDIFLKTNALLNGHFLLTSGRHSNQYFQCALVLQYPEYNELICSLIANHFKDYDIDVVISPAIGGIVVGQEVARQLNKKSIFAEREDKSLTLRRGFYIEEGKKYLICEDVVTTGGSVFEVIEIVRNNGGIVAGVGYIVDRSNNKVNFGVPQFSTLQLDVVSYLPDECPLCKENKIPLVKPGSRKINL
ncbi:MAG: orotate phosphoribosyltransferase [Melioribacter sp.]|uniref:orotate phosphoribosyltransferase n=1 Tax=Rosettibacter primus TaxID=3111523 RepID=UPI00247C5EA4|nr:orotate phosphoribosyltransferase [Melioribacter sp.]